MPVLSAATAGAYSLLRSLGLAAEIPDAGRLLRPGIRQAA
jgi:maleate isomerase